MLIDSSEALRERGRATDTRTPAARLGAMPSAAAGQNETKD